MRILNGDLPRGVVGLALLAGALFCGGCRTTPKSLFTAAGSDWKVQTGLALWRPETGKPEIGGDLVLAGDAAGRRLLQFDKTPLSVVSVQMTSNEWLVQFPQVGRSFSGHQPGPTRFLWLYLPAALTGETLPTPLQFKRKPEGGWRLENSKTGESLEGFLAP